MGTTVREGVPLVSVVLPTYERPEMLVEAVESVASQRYPAVELIVVDDGSETPTREILAEHAPDGLDWRCLEHDHNRGANAARNTGIRAAEGEILAFLDDDDTWYPDKLDAQVSAFEAEGEAVGVVVVGQRFVNRDGETTTIRLPDPEIGENATPALLSGAAAGPFSTIAVRRSVLESAGLPDEEFPAWQDREWLVRLSAHCEFAPVRRPLVERRLGDYEQIGDAFEPKRDETYPRFVEKHRDLAAEYGRERVFVATLAARIAGAGLDKGHYGDARRFAAKAIRTSPRIRSAYLYLALALAGRHVHRSAVKFKRTIERLRWGRGDGWS